MAAVQALRARANSIGALQSTPQQTVVQDGPTIIIESGKEETPARGAEQRRLAAGAKRERQLLRRLGARNVENMVVELDGEACHLTDRSREGCEDGARCS